MHFGGTGTGGDPLEMCPSLDTLANNCLPVTPNNRMQKKKNSKDVLPLNTSPSPVHDANARGRDVFNYFYCQLHMHKSLITGIPNATHKLSNPILMSKLFCLEN